MCVAIGELADGLTVDLDKVTKKYEGLDGTELAISESQERMAVVLDPKDVDAFIQASREENLEATWVATVTEEPRLTMNWRGDTIVNLSRAFLNTNGVTQVAKARITAVDPEKNYRHLVPEKLRGLSMADAFTQNLSRDVYKRQVYGEISRIQPAQERYITPDKTQVYTPIEITPIETLKGDPGPTLLYNRIGGEYEGVIYRLEGYDFSFQEGDRIFIFMGKYDSALGPTSISIEHDGMLTVWAVSYTHLDVYKRQPRRNPRGKSPEHSAGKKGLSDGQAPFSHVWIWISLV